MLPIHGQLVPFHIMAVKSVTVTQDAGASFIRINFNAPTRRAAAANATIRRTSNSRTLPSCAKCPTARPTTDTPTSWCKGCAL